ncbi:MAG: zinc metalloprotease HtpX [bacterium]
MPTLYTQKDANIRKTWLLITVFLVLVIGIGWAFSYQFNSPIILIIAVLFSSAMSITSYWYSDKIVLKMSKAVEVKHDENPDLYHIVENLCITAGLPTPKIYIIDEMAPNAFATGRNPEHAVVAVTKGLLQILDRSELEGVIAHELSHIGNRDMLLSAVVVVLVGMIALLSDWFLRWTFLGGRRRGSRDSGGDLGVFLMIVGLVLAIFSPIIAMMMQMAISRKREFLADTSGALLTRYPEGLARALEKISQSPAKLSVANKATAHLYIANPLRGKKVSKLFMTHPPIEERLKALRSMR